MRVRKATIDDYEGILELMRRMQPNTNYADIPIDDKSVKMLVGSGIFTRREVSYVAEHEGNITGVLVGGLTPYLWNEKKFYATDVLFMAEQGGVWLLRKFVRWAKLHHKTHAIILCEDAGHHAKVKALYERVGFKQIGGMFRMEFTQCHS